MSFACAPFATPAPAQCAYAYERTVGRVVGLAACPPLEGRQKHNFPQFLPSFFFLQFVLIYYNLIIRVIDNQTKIKQNSFNNKMKTNGTWKIKDSQEKYKNPWIRVREDLVIRPDGKDGIFGVVEMVPGVSVLPFDNGGYVYLVKEFHYAIEQNSTEVISGAIDKGENNLQAAKRELKEETGITADEWVNLGTINPFTTVIKSPATMYLAKKLHFSKANPEVTEKINIIKIKFNKAVEMVMQSEITHGPSCVLILKTAEYLKNKKLK
ncbi:MAG: NUDIX hydrolase [Patescibacteria group bacterium]